MLLFKVWRINQMKFLRHLLTTLKGYIASHTACIISDVAISTSTLCCSQLTKNELFFSQHTHTLHLPQVYKTGNCVPSFPKHIAFQKLSATSCWPCLQCHLLGYSPCWDSHLSIVERFYFRSKICNWIGALNMGGSRRWSNA